jgi:hypothetical protein
MGTTSFVSVPEQRQCWSKAEHIKVALSTLRIDCSLLLESLEKVDGILQRNATQRNAAIQHLLTSVQQSMSL